MEFRTKVEILPFTFKLDYHTISFFVGSCFADNIGIHLERLKFPIVHNPFGVLYNPSSIKDNLKVLIEKKLFSDSDLYYFNEKWISFSHYTAFDNADKHLSLERINHSLKTSADVLSNAQFLFITFGTAWVYEFIKLERIVANCHKIPSHEFRRFMLNSDQIAADYTELFDQLHTLNPQLKIIFTLSPIRHWKDGAVDNLLSKSTLLVAIHKIKENFEFVSYFPAYEIFMDELRDYRYYAKDMLHPSEIAIDYIWQRFTDTYMDAGVLPVMRDIDKITTAINHRPLNPESKEYAKFRRKMVDFIGILQLKYSFLDFSNEIKFFAEA